MKVKIIVIFIVVIFFSCNSYVERNNEPNDILEARAITGKFYTDMYNGNRNNIYQMFTDSSSMNDFKNLSHAKDSILGKMLTFDIINVNTKHIESKDINQVQYSIELGVKYQKGKNKEFVKLIKNGKAKMILESYHFEPSE